jgi:O-antigen ligase
MWGREADAENGHGILTRVSVLQLTILLLAPWWYGGAPDTGRYLTATTLLLSVSAWLWRQPALETRIATPAAGLVAWAILQTLFASTSSTSTLESAIVVTAILAVVVFWSTAAQDESMARRLVYVTLAACLAQAIFGILQSTLNPHHVYSMMSDVTTMPFGSYVDHNHFAGFVEMGALLAAGAAAGRAMRGKGIDPQTIVFAGISLALVAAHVASRSRGGLIALVVGAAAMGPLWILARHRSRSGTSRGRPLLIAAILGALLLAFGWFAAPESAREHLARLLHGSHDPSGHYRVAIFGATLRLWLSHPLAGCGLGNYADALGRFKTSEGAVATQHAESDALEFLAEGGLIGVLLLGGLAAGILRNFHQRLTQGHDRFRMGMAIGAMAAVIALCVHSFLDFNLRLPANAIVFAALVGLAGAPRTPGHALSARWCRPAATVIALLAAASIWRTWGAFELARTDAIDEPNARVAALNVVLRHHPYLAEAHMRRGLAWWTLAKGPLSRLRLEHAQADLEACVHLRPSWSDAWADLGWLHFLLGDAQAARVAFDRAGELEPARISIGVARAEFFARVGARDAAVVQLQRTHRYNADWPWAAVLAVADRLGLDRTKIEIDGPDR